MKRIIGQLKLKDSLIHGALIPNFDQKSNVTEIRKIPVYCDEVGNYISVPAVSGNSIRGTGRRAFMSRTFESLELDPNTEIPLDVLYLFFAGGTTSNAKPVPPNRQVYKDLRSALPFLDLLGGTYRGHYFRSNLIVRFAVPLVRETAALYPELKIDSVEITASELIAVIKQNPVGYTKTALEGSKEGLSEEEKGQMIFYYEAIPAGTTLLHEFGLRDGVSALTESAFYAFIEAFLTRCTLGSNSARGHGKFEGKYYENRDTLTAEELAQKSGPYWEYLEKNRNRIKETILGIPEQLQAKEKESEKIKNKQESDTGDE